MRANISILRLAIIAIIAIIVAALIDGLDGRIARLIKGTSKVGKELDSLTDVITYEFENVPVESINTLNPNTVFPSSKALEIAQDRLKEKQLFDSLNIPVAKYMTVTTKSDLLDAKSSLGFPFILKTRRFGYDGKGQSFINDEKNQIIGSVIYIDNYGNVVTNIKHSFFKEASKGRKYEISARNHKFKRIYNNYSEIVDYSILEEKRKDEKNITSFEDTKTNNVLVGAQVGTTAYYFLEKESSIKTKHRTKKGN